MGICQLVTHDALDAATQGFDGCLNEAPPGQVEFDVQNAAGDSSTCSTIVNSFVADGVDLILANATPPSRLPPPPPPPTFPFLAPPSPSTAWP
ncbi:MAG: ABC transporter substrate binding protein [Intestinimonas sp.]